MQSFNLRVASTCDPFSAKPLCLVSVKDDANHWVLDSRSLCPLQVRLSESLHRWLCKCSRCFGQMRKFVCFRKCWLNPWTGWLGQLAGRQAGWQAGKLVGWRGTGDYHPVRAGSQSQRICQISHLIRRVAWQRVCMENCRSRKAPHGVLRSRCNKAKFESESESESTWSSANDWSSFGSAAVWLEARRFNWSYEMDKVRNELCARAHPPRHSKDCMCVCVCECNCVCASLWVRVQTDNERMWEFENWIWVLCNTAIAGCSVNRGTSTAASAPLTCLCPLASARASVSTQSIY